MARSRFGKFRVSNCECTTRFTCGPCCEAAAARNLADANAAPKYPAAPPTAAELLAQRRHAESDKREAKRNRHPATT